MLILCTFTDLQLNLSEQLVKLSKLSHILLYVYRRNGTSFIMNDLYHDIQSNIQNSYISTSILKSINNEHSLHLFRLGTDQLEQIFSVQY